MRAPRSTHPSDMWKEREPDCDQRAVMQLARAIERKRDPEFVSVSYEAQVEAHEYYEKHGFADTLTRMFELEQETT